MTTSINFDTVATSIAGLTITGVSVIKDTTNVTSSASMSTPILMPRPNDFVTNFHEVPEDRTFGTQGGELTTWEYTLNYTFLECQAGGALGYYTSYSSAITHLKAIFAAIAINDVINSAVDLRFETIASIGVIQDPSGKEFLGCEIALHVREYTGG